MGCGADIKAENEKLKTENTNLKSDNDKLKIEVQKLVRRKSVEMMTGLSRSALYEKMAQGEFPKPIRLGTRSVAWVLSEIECWISKRIDESRGEILEGSERGKK